MYQLTINNDSYGSEFKMLSVIINRINLNVSGILWIFSSCFMNHMLFTNISNRKSFEKPCMGTFILTI